MLALLSPLLHVLLPLAAAIARPERAACPSSPGWWVNGVRPDGTFACLHTAVIESDAPADLELVGRIYCAPGQIPLVLTERRVACGPQRQGA